MSWGFPPVDTVFFRLPSCLLAIGRGLCHRLHIPIHPSTTIPSCPTFYPPPLSQAYPLAFVSWNLPPSDNPLFLSRATDPPAVCPLRAR